MTEPAEIEVVEAGLAVALQDRGRLGWRRLGVPLAGALDPVLLALVNALLGNDAGAAALEVPASGPTLKVRRGPVRFALVGPIAAKVLDADGTARAMPGWSTVTLGAGETLQIVLASAAATEPSWPLAIGYVGASGGFDVAEVLGSRSTYARAALGGVQGRVIRVGDLLPCGALAGTAACERHGPAPFQHVGGPIRVLPGPQADHFTDEALDAFFGATFTLTRDSDRMGMRLRGPALAHNSLGAEIASDGVTPGSVQVPADGQPIVLMVDGQTVGGYPKIATVIRADLPRLAHLRPGASLRFAHATSSQAGEARAELAARVAKWVGSVESLRPRGRIDEAALYACNLVSGMVRGDGLDRDPNAAAG